MSFFKKSVLTLCFVLLLLTVLVLPSFAEDSENLISPDLRQWSPYVQGNTMSSTQAYVSADNESRIFFNENSNGAFYLRFDSAELDYNSTYTLSFKAYGSFNYVNCIVLVSLNDDFLDLNGAGGSYELLRITERISNVLIPTYEYKFVPSQLNLRPGDKLSVCFWFVGKSSADTVLYFRDISLTKQLPQTDIDTGSWTGPDLQITDIDIENDISNIATSGGSLITFLQQGFSRVRVGVVGVAALFTSCWDYLTTYTPELTYIIVFGLVLGLLGMLISIFKFGKESGNTGKSSSSKSDKGGGSS